MPMKNYSQDNVFCALAGIPITELSDAGITIEYDEDSWAQAQGSHGSTTRAKRHNNIATATVRVMQGSPTNDLIQSIMTADMLTGLAPVPFFCRDMGGTSQCSAPYAYLSKPPAMELAMEPAAREWVFKLHNPNMVHGGNL